MLLVAYSAIVLMASAAISVGSYQAATAKSSGLNETVNIHQGTA